MEAVQMYEIHIFISSSLSLTGELRANLITPAPSQFPNHLLDSGIRENFTLGIRNPGPTLESRIQLKEFEVLLTIGIQNSSSTDKDWNPVPEIWTDPRHRI